MTIGKYKGIKMEVHMKKEKNFVKKLLAGFCATALLFGALSCSSDSDDDEDSTVTTENGDGNNENTDGDGEGDGDGDGNKPVTLKVGSSSTSYATIAEALSAAASASGDCEITLATGTYEEDGLSYSGSNNLKISGLGTAEYGSDVVILGQGSDITTEKGRSTFAIAGSGNIVLENLTIKSTRQNATGDAQAEVIGTDGTGNLAAYNCSFLSGQDTLRTVAKAWFYKCYIEGDVDFLWMEYTNGVAALYEECVLHAISSRTTKAYFTAPRLGLTSKVGKGLVVYNSKLEADSGLEKVYLGRNPWASSAMSSYYEQVAFVGTTYDNSNVELNTDIWGSAANGTTDQKYIGFKTDKNFAAGKYGTVIDDEFVATEYAGRENILNRLYVVASEKFQKDTDGYWDIAKVISDNGWTVTEDTSKSLLDGETEVESKTYDFANTISTYTDLVTSGTVNDNDVDKTTNVRKSHVVLNADATLSFPVTGNCVVTVTGYYKGEGSIQAGSQGKALLDFNNNSTSKLIEKSYVVYSGACDVTITATATTYITKIVVEYDDSLTFKPVTAITLSTADDATEVASKKTLQFSATIAPTDVTNDDIVWSITSGSEVATIDQNGLLTAGSADADTSVTVRATSCDANAVYGEKTITVKKLEANACDITWFGGSEFSANGTSSDDSVLTAGEATAEYLGGFADQTVTTGYGKVNATTGCYWQCTSNAATGGDADVAFFKLTIPVTAVQALKITNITGTFDESVTGNITRTISVGGSDEVNIGDGKTVSLNKEFDVSLSAGQTVNVVITTYVKASKTINANKTAKQCVSNLCVSCEKQ